MYWPCVLIGDRAGRQKLETRLRFNTMPSPELAGMPQDQRVPLAGAGCGPRFRALALFGRRSPERVVRSPLPAAENLHTTGLTNDRIVAIEAMASSAPRRPLLTQTEWAALKSICAEQ